jgi:hypothetical protein
MIRLSSLLVSNLIAGIDRSARDSLSLACDKQISKSHFNANSNPQTSLKGIIETGVQDKTEKATRQKNTHSSPSP